LISLVLSGAQVQSSPQVPPRAPAGVDGEIPSPSSPLLSKFHFKLRDLVTPERAHGYLRERRTFPAEGRCSNRPDDCCARSGGGGSTSFPRTTADPCCDLRRRSL